MAATSPVSLVAILDPPRDPPRLFGWWNLRRGWCGFLVTSIHDTFKAFQK